MACNPALAATVSFAATGVTTFTTKKPEYGNAYEKDLRIIAHRSRSSKLYLYKRGDPVNAFSLVFVGLNYEDKNLFETFVDDSRGKFITYTDHFSDAHVGWISAWNWTETGKENGFDVSVEFEIS